MSKVETSVMDIANELIRLANEEERIISNLRIQKLVYYIQGISLAEHKEPMFREEIEAWKHGPVVRELYYELCDTPAGFTPPLIPHAKKIVDEKKLALIKEVYDSFKSDNIWRIVNATHEKNTPWWITKYNRRKKIIDLDLMQSHFEEIAESE